MHKTREALDLTGAQTLIIAGGVIANKKIRESFKTLEEEFPELKSKKEDQLIGTTIFTYMLDILHGQGKPEIKAREE